MESLNGVVDKIIYRNEENGFTVFSFNEKVNGELSDDFFTAKGIFINIEKNDELILTGEMIIDPNYGLQFDVKTYDYNLPKDLEQLKKYIGSGIISGIGPARANTIVDKFGDKTPWILEHEPLKLMEISGIGKRTAELAGKSMAARGDMNRMLMTLVNYGISPNLGMKIYNEYEDESMNVIRKNPYELTKIRGIGFLMADKIGLKLGFKMNSPFRIQSGLIYVLKQICKYGHMYCKEGILVNKAKNMLKVSDIGNALDIMQENKEIFIDEDDNIYLREYYHAEKNLAYNIKRIISGKSNMILDEKLLEYVSGNLNEKQKSAIVKAVENQMIVLTGGAGTGKTTTLNAMIKYFATKGMSISLAAPTGRAAKRMMEATKKESKTIHRLLESKGNDSFERNSNNPLECDVLIVDEVSMLDCLLADALFSAIDNNKKIILVGDKNQLPSVGPGNVLADIINSNICNVIELTEVYRQKEDSHIISNANAILNGQPLNLSNRSIDFFFKEAEDPETIKNMLLHYTVDSLPTYTGEKDIQVLSAIKKGPLGINNLNSELQDKINPNGVEKNGFRVNDKVMQIVNDYERKKVDPDDHECTGVFNGDMGFVSSIDHINEYICVTFDDGYTSQYEFEDLDDLTLAYALTIHKSQGAEYPVVVVPIYDFIPTLTTRNLIYTAVTRARKTILLIGSKKKLYDIINNTSVAKRNSSLIKMLV